MQSGLHANCIPRKKGMAAIEEAAPKAAAAAGKDQKSTAADAAGDEAASGCGGRKRCRASMEEVAEGNVSLTKSASACDLQSKAHSEAAQEEKEVEKEEAQEVAASPVKQPAEKSAKRGGTVSPKFASGRATKRVARAEAEDANEED